MEECVIDQLRTCIIHMLKAKFSSVLYVTPHIEKRESALFFSNSTQLDDIMMLFAGKSYIKAGYFNRLDKMFQEYHPKAIILPIASTGAATKIVYENLFPKELRNDRFLNDYGYMSLFQKYLIDQI